MLEFFCMSCFIRQLKLICWSKGEGYRSTDRINMNNVAPSKDPLSGGAQLMLLATYFLLLLQLVFYFCKAYWIGYVFACLFGLGESADK